jgi:hypothetical protein
MSNLPTLTEYLQDTATAIRAEYSDPFHVAVAEWLDNAATLWGDTDPRFIGIGGAHVDHPINVAKAYRGDA